MRCTCFRSFQAENGALALLGPEKSHQMADQGGLSRPIGTQQAEGFPRLHLETQAEHTPIFSVIPGQVCHFDHAVLLVKHREK